MELQFIHWQVSTTFTHRFIHKLVDNVDKFKKFRQLATFKQEFIHMNFMETRG